MTFFGFQESRCLGLYAHMLSLLVADPGGNTSIHNVVHIKAVEVDCPKPTKFLINVLFFLSASGTL